MSKAKKVCVQCGEEFFRNPKYGRAQWERAKSCSAACAGRTRITHGQRNSRLYRVWAGIKNRCLNSNDPIFSHYGGRGIEICQRWRDDFAAFAADVGPDPGNGFDVGRIDNEMGYEPGNVRWETEKQNARNKRTTRWVDFRGEVVSLIDACERTGVPYKRAFARLDLGWSVERALAP